MGCVDTIKHDRFPAQGKHLGRAVRVCFHYDTDHQIKGRVIRDDAEEPFELLIMLEDERCVRAVECMYTLEQETDRDPSSA